MLPKIRNSVLLAILTFSVGGCVFSRDKKQAFAVGIDEIEFSCLIENETKLELDPSKVPLNFPLWRPNVIYEKYGGGKEVKEILDRGGLKSENLTTEKINSIVEQYEKGDGIGDIPEEDVANLLLYSGIGNLPEERRAEGLRKLLEQVATDPGHSKHVVIKEDSIKTDLLKEMLELAKLCMDSSPKEKIKPKVEEESKS